MRSPEDSEIRLGPLGKAVLARLETHIKSNNYGFTRWNEGTMSQRLRLCSATPAQPP